MLTGPKKAEYFSLIAPPGKKALYLGYVNIPIAIGQAIGAKIAGWQYGTYGEKAMLSLRYLAEKTNFAHGNAWNGDVSTLEAVSRNRAQGRVRDARQGAGSGPQRGQPAPLDNVPALPGLVSVRPHRSLLARRDHRVLQISKRWKDMNV